MVTPDSADAAAARATDRPAKIARIRELLDAHGARELAVTAPENLAWFFDGARVQVPYAGAPVARAVVDRDGGIRVYALANEVDRLTAEELGGVEMHPVPWSDSLPDPAPDVLVDTAVAAELRAARAVLLPVERARYAALGAEVAHATGEVLRRARPEHSEQALAGELARAVVALGAEPVVLLVAGSSRLAWRHPLPTAAPLGRRAMAGEVEAAAFAATRPGRTLAEALADIRDAYPAHGFDTEEWTRHHQGGPTGYLGRDPKATFATHDVIRAGQAFAWNPSAPGAKVEDTVIVDADGIRVLTADPDWPTTTVHGLDRPLELEL